MKMNFPCNTDAYVPLIWDEPARQQSARPALASILQSAREIGSADSSCIVLLRDNDALEVVCAHRIERHEFLQTFGPGHTGHASLISIPFMQGLRQRGALCLFKLRARQLSELDIELLEGLTAEAELALAVARQQCAIARLETALKLSAPQEELFIESPRMQEAAGIPA